MDANLFLRLPEKQFCLTQRWFQKYNETEARKIEQMARIEGKTTMNNPNRSQVLLFIER